MRSAGSTEREVTRRRHVSVIANANGKLYTVGGSQNGGIVLPTLEAFATNTWSQLAPMPTARSTVGVGVLNGLLFAVGGNDGHKVLDTVEAYNPVTNTWSTMPSMPIPSQLPGVGTINGVLYVAGGFDPNQKPQNILQAFATCSVNVNQAVDNADIDSDGFMDLVADRPAVVRITRCGTNPGAFDVHFVNTTATAAGANGMPLTNSSVNTHEVDFGFTPSSVTDLGKGSITVDILANGAQISVPVDVRQTKVLHIPYLEIDSCSGPLFCYGPIDHNFALQSFGQSSDFILGTYPVPGIETKDFASFTGAAILGGFMFDFASAWVIGKAADPRADAVVALVPPDYFQYHCAGGLIGICGSLGLSHPFVRSVLSSVQSFQSPGHETGHVFRLHRSPPLGPGEEYVTNPPGNCGPGFWVNRNQPISDGICLMGFAAQAGFTFTGNCFQDSTVKQRHVWIDKADYEDLFRTLKPAGDPPILILAGVIMEDNIVQLSPWLMSSAGTPILPGDGGDFSLELLDFNGQLVSSTSFGVDFFAHPDFSGTAVHTGMSPFGFALPYPPNAAAVQIMHGDEVLVKVSVTGKLLSDAISNLPESAFRRHPSRRRQQLLEEIHDVEREIAKKDIKGAIRELLNLRRALDHQLLDFFDVQPPLQFTKAQIMALVNEQIQRLETQIAREGNDEKDNDRTDNR